MSVRIGPWPWTLLVYVFDEDADQVSIDADKAYIAEVPELPGCAADGGRHQEAIANVEVIIDEWIETAEELGRPVPKPKGRRLLHA